MLRAVLPLLCLHLVGARLMKAISYGPVPLKAAGRIPQDDWMVEAAKPMWGPRGRDDLHVMKQLGANTVRLYGNNPNQSHEGFLDEAHRQELKVVAGMSDFPYIQMDPGRCIETDYDCFNQSRDSYALNLKTGFLTEYQEYHPALAYFILINEPDLKMPSTSTTVAGGPEQMARAVVSAFDGLLEAEKMANITGDLINITATFSYAVCIVCEELSYLPALGQMATLVDAMMNPESYGYEPRNNVTEAFWSRWTHSFNTNNPARDLKAQFFDRYPEHFPSTPVFVAEYHSVILQYLTPVVTLQEDLAEVIDMANTSDLFLGISFFQYQVAYWKGGTEMDFGIFGLGNFLIAEMPYYGHTYDIWCLEPQVSHNTPGSTMPQVLTEAYDGPGLEYEYLCQPSPNVVPLSQDGFAAIAAQGAGRLGVFARRVVEHLGGMVVSTTELEAFAAQYVTDSGRTFAEMVSAIAQKPPWTSFSAQAACVSDRAADAGQVGAAIAWLCGHTPGFSCDVPDDCSQDAFSTGDWLFSRWYLRNGHDPLQDCSFGGAAIFASPDTPAGRAAAACAVVVPRRLEVMV
ncbi:unnamed protein product [Durusdinium trenchii]|uniref:X8 domain-containing protein n=2 Tax=Durusdinium trenchii TaxID=1381693 RepID=A0ABP0HSC4_9DINO